jgi:hypothetical protein
MTTLRKAGIGAATLTLIFFSSIALSSTSLAQEGPGGTINPGRDCRTITTCNFSKGGSYRGCLSSYSCRVCRYVASNCAIGGTRKRCHTSVCSWG